MIRYKEYILYPDSSWDRFMTVIEDIESLDLREKYYKFKDDESEIRYNFEGISVDIEGNSCYIGINWMLDPWELVSSSSEGDKKQSTYIALEKFIEWYNANI